MSRHNHGTQPWTIMPGRLWLGYSLDGPELLVAHEQQASADLDRDCDPVCSR